MSWEQRLHWPVLGLVFLFPVVAASVKDGGSTVFALLLLMGLVWGWPAWKNLTLWEKRVLKGFMVFFVVLLLTMINTEDYSSAVRKLERFVRLLAVIPVYLLLRRLQLNVSQALFYGAIVGCFVMAGQAWYYANILDHEVVHGAYHKIVFGDTAVLLAAIAAAGALTLATKWWHYLGAVIAVFAGLYASLLSMTRGAWLLIPVAMVLWMWLYRSKITKKSWAIIGVTLLIGMTVGTVWMPKKLEKGIEVGIAELKAYQNQPGRPSSWGSRLNMWRDSIYFFKQHPILGIGIGDFQKERQRLIDEGKTYKDHSYGHAHSIYFHALATTGLIGFIALLACIIILPFMALYRLWNKALDDIDHFYMLGCLTAITAFAVFGLTEGWLVRNPFMNEYLLFTTFFMVSAYSKLSIQQESISNQFTGTSEGQGPALS
ncbi:O-antigen ligase family protein [Kaarinaea lacus]